MTDTPQIVTDKVYHTIDHLLSTNDGKFKEDEVVCRYLRFDIGYAKGTGIILSVGEHQTIFNSDHPEWKTTIHSMHSPMDARLLLEERKRRYRKNEDKLYEKLLTLPLRRLADLYGPLFPEEISVLGLTDENDPRWAEIESERAFRTRHLGNLAAEVASDLNG